jgi:hypothetical protein
MLLKLEQPLPISVPKKNNFFYKNDCGMIECSFRGENFAAKMPTKCPRKFRRITLKNSQIQEHHKT